MFFHDQSSPPSLAPLQPAQKKIQNWVIRTSAALEPLVGSLFMSIMLAAETGSSKNHSTIISFRSTFWLIVFCPHQKEWADKEGVCRGGMGGVGDGSGGQSPASAHQLLNIVHTNNLNLKKLSNTINNTWHFIKSARKPWRDQSQSYVFQAQAFFKKALLLGLCHDTKQDRNCWVVGSNLLWRNVTLSWANVKRNEKTDL